LASGVELVAVPERSQVPLLDTAPETIIWSTGMPLPVADVGVGEPVVVIVPPLPAVPVVNVIVAACAGAANVTAISVIVAKSANAFGTLCFAVIKTPPVIATDVCSEKRSSS